MHSYREEFKKETGISWKNGDGEPDIEYVEWLEKKLGFVKNLICPKCRDSGENVEINLVKKPECIGVCQCGHRWNLE